MVNNLCLEYTHTETQVPVGNQTNPDFVITILPLLVYRIYPAIRRGFCSSRMTSNNYISPMKFCYNTNFTLPFLNNPKDLDPSYKTDLDLWDCFERKNLCLITEEIG